MTVKPKNTSPATPAEHRPADEYANFVTHALGLLLSIVAAAILMPLAAGGDQPVSVVGCAIYCCSLTGLYAASTLSHMFHDLAWRRFFRTLDQAFIYLLIAGSFTPVAVVFLWDHWWPAMLVVMWVLAVLGVLLVLYMRDLSPMAKITYGVLGWLPVISLKTLVDVAPPAIFSWILVGGFFYSVGAVFLRFDRHVRYFHALWHTFVIAGSICHYIAILLVVS